ncbi:hypothetical protein [Sutcliffiella deserti]|uniref:hypothetical protein n=1 Tax=Sutcliffiella deserti TaxID=2875501 RepID=UPI001CC1632B|nr:hypothetical protein [Sutcliffiella deserti]
MRWFFAVLLILFGAFLLSLTYYGKGNTGHIIMKIIGLGFFVIAGLISKTRKKHNST